MKKIVVLGCGLVGRVMAEDLSKDHEVTSVDISKQNLEKLTAPDVLMAVSYTHLTLPTT